MLTNDNSPLLAVKIIRPTLRNKKGPIPKGVSEERYQIGDAQWRARQLPFLKVVWDPYNFSSPSPLSPHVAAAQDFHAMPSLSISCRINETGIARHRIRAEKGGVLLNVSGPGDHGQGKGCWSTRIILPVGGGKYMIRGELFSLGMAYDIFYAKFSL